MRVWVSLSARCVVVWWILTFSFRLSWRPVRSHYEWKVLISLIYKFPLSARDLHWYPCSIIRVTHSLQFFSLSLWFCLFGIWRGQKQQIADPANLFCSDIDPTYVPFIRLHMLNSSIYLFTRSHFWESVKDFVQHCYWGFYLWNVLSIDSRLEFAPDHSSPSLNYM